MRKREGLSFEMIGSFGPKKTHRSFFGKKTEFFCQLDVHNKWCDGTERKPGNLGFSYCDKSGTSHFM